MAQPSRKVPVIVGIVGLAALALGVLAGCPGTPKVPTGPAPEYEDPPPPSWMKDAGAPTETLDAGPPPA